MNKSDGSGIILIVAQIIARNLDYQAAENV